MCKDCRSVARMQALVPLDKFEEKLKKNAMENLSGTRNLRHCLKI